MIKIARCGCSGQACSCFVEAGAGITITGSGSSGTPWVISSDGTSTTVDDTATIDMHITGSGTSLDPYVLFGNVKLDPDAGNLLSATANGLILTCSDIQGCGITGLIGVDDTPTVNMSISGTGTSGDPYVLSAAIKLSATAGNLITSDGTGIYLSCADIQSCLSAANGLSYSSLTGVTQIRSDYETFVPAGATAGTDINAAIAALPATGGLIILGAGTHSLDTGILLSKPVTIEGVGVGATLISFNAAVVPTAIAMSDTTQRRIQIRNLRINTTTASDNTGTAINANYFINSIIEEVSIGDSSNQTPNIGIDFNVVGTYYNTVDKCRISVGGAGSVGVRGANNANDNSVRNTKITGDAGSTTSVQLNTAHSWTLDKVTSDTAGLAIGFDLQTAAHDTTMIGCYLEGLAIGLKIASGVESPRYIGGYISSSTTANVQDNGAVGLTIDNSWIAFDPYNSIDRKGVVKSQINGVNSPDNVYGPGDQNLIAWTYDAALNVGSGGTVTSGVIYLMQVNIRYAVTITNLLVGLVSSTATSVANQNFLGLYNSAGTLVAQSSAGTADTPFQSSGIKTIALSAPYAAAPGKYWVAMVANFSAGAITALRSGHTTGSLNNPGLAVAALRFATNGTGTTLPASITPASNANSTVGAFWAACS